MAKATQPGTRQRWTRRQVFSFNPFGTSGRLVVNGAAAAEELALPACSRSGGTLVALGESMLPGLWKEGAPHRVWLKGKRSALLHFQAVLSFLSVLLCSFLQVHEEDWIFSYFLEGIPLPSLYPFIHQLSYLISHILFSWDSMPDILTFPWRQPTAQT